MSASGIRVASPTKSDATASARNAGSRTHVISNTTSATPMAAMVRRVAGLAGNSAIQQSAISNQQSEISVNKFSAQQSEPYLRESQNRSRDRPASREAN